MFDFRGTACFVIRSNECAIASPVLPIILSFPRKKSSSFATSEKAFRAFE